MFVSKRPVHSMYVLLSLVLLFNAVGLTACSTRPPQEEIARKFLDAVFTGKTMESAQYVCGDALVLPLNATFIKPSYQVKMLDNDGQVAHIAVTGDLTISVVVLGKTVTFKKALDFIITVKAKGADWCVDEGFSVILKGLVTPVGG